MMYGGTYIARPGHSTAPDMIIMIDDQLIPVVIMTTMNDKHKAHNNCYSCQLSSQVLVVHIYKNWNTHSPQFESSTQTPKPKGYF